jgi:hypothetical protein
MRVRANEMGSGRVRAWDSPPEKREDETMHNEAKLNELLAKWHRWAQAPARVDDSLMRDFDALVCQIGGAGRIALAFRARNLVVGAEVFSSQRFTPQDTAAALERLDVLLMVDRNRWFGPRVIKLNLRGNRIGESNPMAELSDRDVELLLEMRAETDEAGSPKYSLQWLADKFEVPKSTVSDICSGRRRNQAPARVKVV